MDCKWKVWCCFDVYLVFQRVQDSGFVIEWTAIFSFRHEAIPSVVSPVKRSGKYLLLLHSLRIKLSRSKSSPWGLHFWDAWAQLAGAASALEVSNCCILQRSLQWDASDTEPPKGLVTPESPGMPVVWLCSLPDLCSCSFSPSSSPSSVQLFGEFSHTPLLCWLSYSGSECRNQPRHQLWWIRH